MAQDNEEGKLVETGTFRVDAERMMRVLAKYQLETPLHAVRELVRCAVLSGAPKLQLDRDEGPEGKGFRAEFGGAALSAGEISDIYAPLLAGEQGRGRHLAAAAVALLGTRPARLTLSSGGNSVELAGVGEGAAAAPSDRITLRALWTEEPANLKMQSVISFPAEAEGALACCPVTVRSEESECPGLSWRDKPAYGLTFGEGGRRGFLEPLLEDGSAPLTGAVPAAVSTINLHVAGVYAETLKLELPFAPVVADIGDDALRLDASFGKCVRDDNFAAIKPFIEKKSVDLLKKEARRQETDLHAVGRLLKTSRPRRLWREWMAGRGTRASGGRSPLAFLGGLWRWFTVMENNSLESYLQSPPLQEEALISAAARRTWWLQDACRRALKGALKAPPAPELQCLWTAPVLFSRHGNPLSLAALQKRVAGGKLPVVEQFYGEGDFESGVRAEAVWLASARDREFLKAFVPEENWE